jgi:hypothetical protein
MKKILFILITPLFFTVYANAQNKTYVVSDHGRKLYPYDMTCPNRRDNQEYFNHDGLEISKFFKLIDAFKFYDPMLKRYYQVCILSTVMQKDDEDPIPEASKECLNKKNKRIILVSASINKDKGYSIVAISEDIILNYEDFGSEPYLSGGVNKKADGFTLSFSYGSINRYEYEISFRITINGVFLSEVDGERYRSDGKGIPKSISKKISQTPDNRLNELTKKKIFLLDL